MGPAELEKKIDFFFSFKHFNPTKATA
jgi:hypothetical protein